VTSIERTAYPQFKRAVSARELRETFTPILPERKTIVVYWKGSVPAGLQSLADGQPVSVSFRMADFSEIELMAAARSLVSDNLDIVASAGPSQDCAGVGVKLRPTRRRLRWRK